MYKCVNRGGSVAPRLRGGGAAYTPDNFACGFVSRGLIKVESLRDNQYLIPRPSHFGDVNEEGFGKMRKNQ